MLLSLRGIVGTALAFAVALICLRLGFWQLSRRAERAERNAILEERLLQEPVPLEGLPRDSAGLLYRRVTVNGLFDSRRSIVLPGRALRGTPGVHVLTPLMLHEGAAVLVNRGWLPSPDAATVDLSGLPETGKVLIDGLAVPFPGTERPGSVTRPAADEPARTDTFRQVWYTPDEAALRAQFPYALGAVLVQALPSETAPSFPERLEVPPLDPGPHLGYAVQWFSFAAIAIAGWFLVLMKSRADQNESRRDG